jgi:hypothetical protein
VPVASAAVVLVEFLEESSLIDVNNRQILQACWGIGQTEKADLSSLRNVLLADASQVG